MWEYTDEVMKHYRNPKNVGVIEDASAIGEAGSLICGDMLKLYLKIDENNIVTDAKFQTFGCGSAVASSSILTEMIIGKSLDEVKKITNKDIADKLGGLPPEKMHCSVMGHEALEDALKNYLKIEIKSECDKKIICNCFGICEKKLIEEIRENNLKTLESVTNYTKAGGACGRCKGKIQKVLDSVWNEPQEKLKPLNNVQKIIKINSVIDNYISEELSKDGGNIELVDIDKNVVFVKLTGSCKSCRNSGATLKNFVEKTLREKIDENIEVKQV